MNDEMFQDLKFQIEVSTRYHEWRRATLLKYVTYVKFLSIIGAFLAFAFIWGAPANFTLWIITINTNLAVSVLSALIAFVNILDLVFDFNGDATVHADLYKKFKMLQERIARNQSARKEHMAEWEADAQLIRLDELPIKWAVYALCWNQTAKRFGFGQLRKVGPIRKLLRNVRAYSAQDFPEGVAV